MKPVAAPAEATAPAPVELPTAVPVLGDALRLMRSGLARHEQALREQDPGAACDALVTVANALRLAGDHASAISTLERAEALARGAEQVLPLPLGRTLRTLGMCCSIVGRHQHAMSCLAEAEALLAAGNPADQVSCRLSALNARSRHADSLPPDERAAALQALQPDWQQLASWARESGEPGVESKALGNHAINLSMLGQHAEAAAALRALLPRYRELGLRPNEGLCLGELARCQLALGEPEAARASAQQAMALLEDGGGALEDLVEACELLSQAEEALGSHAQALAALKRVRELQRRQRDEQARAAVLQRELRIELARLTEQWARDAHADPLTGLANRRALEAWLQLHLPAVEQGRPLTVLLLDLDFFKQVNDGHGHHVGDVVLRRVAALMLPLCRETDLAVRYGGEEFLFALGGVEAEAAAQVAERLRHAVAAEDWAAVARGLRVTVSIGLASARELPGPLQAQALFTLADRRLYAAKLAGRNQVVVSG